MGDGVFCEGVISRVGENESSLCVDDGVVVEGVVVGVVGEDDAVLVVV